MQQDNSDGFMVMWSIKQIAERDRIDKSAISRTVAKLIDSHDLPVQRDGRGRVSLVSLAHYDHLRSHFGNSQQVAAFPAGDPLADASPPLPGKKPSAASESRDEALRQEAWLRVQRIRLDQAKEVGELVRADKLAESVGAAGRLIQAEVMRLHNQADDLAMAVGKEGVSGLRLALRKASSEMCVRISDALATVAEAAPATDAPLHQVDGNDPSTGIQGQ